MQPVAPQITHDTWPTIVEALLTLIFMMGHGGYCTQFCLETTPKIPLWLATTYGRCDFPGRMTKNRWLSIDAHLHDGAGRVLHSGLPKKAAKNYFMTYYNLSEVWFPKMDDQISLTLRRRWISWCGRESIAIGIDYKGQQKYLYDCVQPTEGVIPQGAWPKIIDVPLTLIFMMGQGGHCNLFCI